MAVELIPYVTGKTLATIVTRWSNLAGLSLIASGGSAGSFEAYNNSNLSTYRVAASAEQGTTGVYTVTVPTSSVLPITLTFNTTDTGTGLVIATGTTTLDALGAAADTGAGLATDVYYADIQFTRDQTNTQDEYTVQWFKNAAPITSGITSPTIQVVKRADGTDLIASSAMTEIGSTEALKYDSASSAERQTQGQAVVVYVQATIDSGTRTWRRVIGRDS